MMNRSQNRFIVHQYSQRIVLVNQSNAASLRGIFGNNLERASSRMLQSNATSMEQISYSVTSMAQSSQYEIRPVNSLAFGKGSQLQLPSNASSQVVVQWNNAGSILAIGDAGMTTTSEFQIHDSAAQEVAIRRDNIGIPSPDSEEFDDQAYCSAMQLQNYASEDLFEEVQEQVIDPIPDESINSDENQLLAIDTATDPSPQNVVIKELNEIGVQTDEIQILR